MKQVLAVTTALVCLAAAARAQEEAPLRKAADLEAETSVAEARRVEKELEEALEQVRQRRRQIEARLDAVPRDAGAPERTTDDVRIVNGVSTWAFPAVGAVIKGASAADARSWCTGTLIDCRHFLTANHCVEEDRQPGSYRVFLQNGGIFEVEAISPPHAEYAFPHADLAILRLGREVEGITSIALNTAAVNAATAGTIVGFGRTGGSRSDYGIKRQGRVRTAACTRPETSLLCWNYAAPAGVPGENSNTCNADSGGPLFVSGGADGGTPLLAGVTSGGSQSNCLAGDHSYDVDVRRFDAWIRAFTGPATGTAACGSVAPVGGAATSVFGAGGRLEASRNTNFRFTVPSGMRKLRVAMNAEDRSTTNVDLFVRRGERASPQQADCAGAGAGNYAFCEFDAPQSGPWFIHLRQGSQGGGDFQVVVTLMGAGQ